MRNKMLATNLAPRIEGVAGALAVVLATAGASGGTELCTADRHAHGQRDTTTG
jgi:hypothetical protein